MVKEEIFSEKVLSTLFLHHPCQKLCTILHAERNKAQK